VAEPHLSPISVSPVDGHIPRHVLPHSGLTPVDRARSASACLPGAPPIWIRRAPRGQSPGLALLAWCVRPRARGHADHRKTLL
jgi:hypothetical protein